MEIYEEEADEDCCTSGVVRDHHDTARDVAVKRVCTSQPYGARSIGRDDYCDLMRAAVQSLRPFGRRSLPSAVGMASLLQLGLRPEARGPRSLAGPQVLRGETSLHVYSHVGPRSLILPQEREDAEQKAPASLLDSELDAGPRKAGDESPLVFLLGPATSSRRALLWEDLGCLARPALPFRHFFSLPH